MPRRLPLSEEEKFKINRMLGKGDTPAVIARALNRSKRCTGNYLRNLFGYGKKKPTGRPRILSRSEKSAINSGMRCKKASIRKVTTASCVNTSHTNVYKHIIRDGRYAYQTKLQTLNHELCHVQVRLHWTIDHAHWKDVWNRLSFRMRSVSISMALMAVDNIGGTRATKEERNLAGTQKAVTFWLGLPFHWRIKRP